MNSRIIVTYKSAYGATETYAKWIAEALDAQLAEIGAVKPGNLENCEVVIHGGGLYAGGIAGIKAAAKIPCNHLIVFTVGLADPETTDYGPIIGKLSPDLSAGAKFFHLRGGIDYKRLGTVHKAMMAMMKRSILKKGKAEYDSEDELFLETYGGQIDFMDRESIAPLVNYVQNVL